MKQTSKHVVIKLNNFGTAALLGIHKNWNLGAFSFLWVEKWLFGKMCRFCSRLADWGLCAVQSPEQKLAHAAFKFRPIGREPGRTTFILHMCHSSDSKSSIWVKSQEFGISICLRGHNLPSLAILWSANSLQLQEASKVGPPQSYIEASLCQHNYISQFNIQYHYWAC